MSEYIIKETNRYNSEPYSGPVCAEAGVEEGKIYSNYGHAIYDAAKLSRHTSHISFRVLDLQEVLKNEALVDREDRDAIAN